MTEELEDVDAVVEVDEEVEVLRTEEVDRILVSSISSGASVVGDDGPSRPNLRRRVADRSILSFRLAAFLALRSIFSCRSSSSR